MPANRPLPRSVTFFLLAASACDQSDYEIIPDYPTYEDAMCKAEDQSGFFANRNTAFHHGTSVAIMSFGSSSTAMNTHRMVVSGGPGSGTNDEPGRVQFLYADPVTGLLDPSLGYDRQWAAPISSGAVNLGWSMIAADFRDCYLAASGTHENACGQEVLVGAPNVGTHSNAGRVFWWEAEGSTVNGLIRYGGMVPTPSSLSKMAEFGKAIAAPVAPVDPDLPWNIGGATSPWVAISAPGDSQVFVYNVDPTRSQPLVWAQTLTAPILGRGFGHSLAAGDFDGDGLYDLAVGAPLENGTDLRGLVWVYRGLAGVNPVESTPSVELAGDEATESPATDATHFGWALAAGGLLPGAAGDTLVVGAPLTDESATVAQDDGAVCQYSFTSISGSLQVDERKCSRNKFPSATHATVSTTEHLGWSLAIGNFHNSDNLGGTKSDEAHLPELAIGRPGANSGRGAVDVFLTDDAGFDQHSTWTSIYQWGGSVKNARFGESIAGGYVQETRWQDIAIGSPDQMSSLRSNGAVTLSQAVDTTACLDINGTWEAVDRDGDLVKFRVWSQDFSPPSTHIKLLGAYSMALYEGYGTGSQRTCKWEDNAGDIVPAEFNLLKDTDLRLPGSWPCGASSKTWHNVDATMLLESMGVEYPGVTATMTVELTLLSATELSLDMKNFDVQFLGASLAWDTVMNRAKVDDVDCKPNPLPIEMVQLIPGVCE
jgi:hypothetical protein